MKLKAIPQTATACLAGLFLLAVAMFVAMLVGTEPHPPAVRGPYLSAVCALSLVSIWLLIARERIGVYVGMFTLVAFIPAVGPHKFWTEPAAPMLAPVIAAGSMLVCAGAVNLVRSALRLRTTSDRQES